MHGKWKKIAFCLFVLLAFAFLVRVNDGTNFVSLASNTDNVSIASQFLVEVAGFNDSNYRLTVSNESNPTVISSALATPHFETHVSAIASSEYSESDIVISFIDGNFWSYSSHSLSANSSVLSSEQSFNDSLNALLRIVSGCGQLFNESYWSDFDQLVLTSLQTQQLTAENQNFLLEIQNESTLCATCYAKIDGQYTSPFESLQVYMSSNGSPTNIINNMIIYHVATTNVTISENQAIAIAEPYFEAFAQQNQQNVTAIDTTFSYSSDQGGQRGDNFALYPMWTIDAQYDKIGEYNASSYTVQVWADNGAIFNQGPDAFFAPVSNNNAQGNLSLLLILPVILLFALASGMYLRSKHKVRRK